MKRDYKDTIQNNKDFRTRQHHKDYILVKKLFLKGNKKEVSRLVKEREVSKYFRDNFLLNMASQFNHNSLIKTLIQIPDVIKNEERNKVAFNILVKNKNNKMIKEFIKKDLYQIDLRDIKGLKTMNNSNELWYLEAYIDKTEKYENIKQRERFKVQIADTLPSQVFCKEDELKIKTYCNKITPSPELMSCLLPSNKGLFYGLLDKAIDTFDEKEKKDLILTVLESDRLIDNVEIAKEILDTLDKQDRKLELKIKEIHPDCYNQITKDRVKQNVMNF